MKNINSARIYSKIGAAFYALWSILHIILGIQRLLFRSLEGMLAQEAGRLAQAHWTLIYIGLFSLIISYYNWNNITWAYWVALFIISAEDIGFLLFPVKLGGLGFPASIIGPSLWIVGLTFTSLAFFKKKHGVKLF